MKTTDKNSLKALQEYGQSVWLDYIWRSLITSGELQRLLEEDGLRGMTSNPAIFEKAIGGSTDYQDLLKAPESRTLDAKALYERLAIRDIQDAADVLRLVYEQTNRERGSSDVNEDGKNFHCLRPPSLRLSLVGYALLLASKL